MGGRASKINYGKWKSYSFPILIVKNSVWLASFSQSQLNDYADCIHYRLVTFNGAQASLPASPTQKQAEPELLAAQPCRQGCLRSRLPMKDWDTTQKLAALASSCVEERPFVSVFNAQPHYEKRFCGWPRSRKQKLLAAHLTLALIHSAGRAWSSKGVRFDCAVNCFRRWWSI